VIRWQRFAPYAFLAAAVFAVYANIYGNAFVFDDDLLIRLNSYLRGWDTFGRLFTASTTEGAHIAGGFYRPVQNILYFIVFQIWGEHPFGFHLLNVTLHALNACLGYRLALRLGFDPRAALFAMLIWALHPINTEAVTYMSGTADPLFVFFCLAGLNVLFPRPTLRRVWLCVPLFLLALFSKETAVVFPALVTICLYYKSEDRLKARTYFLTAPLWAIAFAFLAWRVNASNFDGPERYAQLLQLPAYALFRQYAESPAIRVLTFLATLPAYAGLLLWPAGLHMERSFPLFETPLAWQVLVGFAMLIAAAVQIGWNRNKRWLPLSWGLLWFGAAHAPDSGILFAMNSLFLEHWMYLPTIGLFLGLAETAVPFVDRLKKPAGSYAAFGVALAAVVALSARTYDQNEIWGDPVTFYNNIFSYGVVSPRAHNNLAIAYMQRGELPQAIEEYRRAVKEGDTYAETHYNLALALLALPDQKAQIPQAIAELERSIQIEPAFYRSYETLAEIYDQTGDKAKAAAYRHEAQTIFNRANGS
jgi:tetratricopeptide (TPR) repeat protein